MRALIQVLKNNGLSQCERGATAVEYGLILAMIFLAIIVAVSNVATKTVGMWNNVSNEVSAH
ncbi:MAG: Flp family type IVb pilin [Sphingobium sp.]|uniref:Flp family type IVb pilin n=1 Tax=Sphingobium sp. TaxID=1912891 RepID=UPI000DB76306|nr:Flp family type IVb pilin [Sphingobium sp.]PZU10460.1 MAG: Flp family type IVb pilin [Sphingobium sp.]